MALLPLVLAAGLELFPLYHLVCGLLGRRTEDYLRLNGRH
jgi:hypothetical protein